MNRSRSNPHELFARLVHAVKQGVFDDPVGRGLLRAYQCNAADEVVRQLIEGRLRHLETDRVLGRYIPFNAPRLNRGELVLGRDHLGRVIRLRLRWLSAGLLPLSNTGGGKSTLLQFLLLQIAMHGRCIWVSESYKTQLRRLRRYLQRIGLELVIIRPRDWRWNLLQSHLDDPRTHLAMAVDLLVRLLDLPPRARAILNQACHRLYRQFGIWEGQRTAFPTLFDLYELIRSMTGINASSKEAILDRLGSFLEALTPRCAAWRRAWNPAELAKWSIDFEMRGASEIVKQMLLESTLFELFYRQVELGVVNSPLRLFIALDDSQRFFDASSQPGDGALTPMDELAGVIRTTGIGLCVLPQSAVGLSRRLFANLATKVMGRLGSSEDYSIMGGALGLNGEQLEWAKLHLQPGWFIGQVSEGRSREPFLFKVPNIHLPDQVSDLEAATTLRLLDGIPTVPATEFEHWESYPSVEIAPPTPPAEPGLDVTALRVLESIINQPGKPTAFYARQARLNGKRAAELRKQLIKAGLVREHTLATKGRGRPAIVLEPTAEAPEALRRARTNSEP